jgi:ABC-2 type transport system ATP-binding protein
MLQVHRITRKYGSFKAVDNVSFQINQGQIIGLLGQNGAGKTTTLKLISGAIEPDSGQVQLLGMDISKQTKHVQALIGYLPESLPIYPEMMVVDYLDFAAELKQIPAQAKSSELRRVMRAVEIEDKMLVPIGHLSRGYKQRVGVAQAILGQPKLILLDEPTNGLDPKQTLVMRKLMLNLAQEATVILSTHIMQEVDAICSRVLMLNQGKLVVDECLQSLKKTQMIEVETSLPLASMQLLQAMPGIQEISFIQGSDSKSVYRIQIDLQASDLLGSEIAQFVFQQQGHLYRLQPIYRTLETLFREVTSSAASKENLHVA